ncbi:MAG: hypothetical protein HY459_02095 [Parcubacteria group bacterium]|nr:hypothetical protein [Parcubacteria group bacterium]
MSDGWEVIGTEGGSDPISAILEMAVYVGSNGALKPSTTYVVENKETGEIRTVTASDEDELGLKIADGDFD